MMVPDLRSFDIVESVGFNELFVLVTNPNSFGNLDSFEDPYKFENLEIFGYPFRSKENFVFPIRPDISSSRTPLIFVKKGHLTVII